MPDTEPTFFGNFELYSLEAGRFKLDGGAMFGVVPKTLWNKQIPADEKNRIPMGMRCLLIKSKNTGKIYLVDNGSGDKFNEKMASIYGLDYEHSDLQSSLKKCGIEPRDITDMVFTHLHFDHCGGTTKYDKNGEIKEVFPNSTYHVNKQHWKTATNPNKREKASFFSENIDPIKNSGRLNLLDDHHEFEPGFTTLPMNGHTEGQQLPVFTNEDKKIVYAADLIPTFAHIPLPWVMGYDMKPLQTLTEKETFLNEAVEKNWYLFLEHDAEHEIVTVQKENGKFLLKDSLSLADLS
ncbi:MBL fold metallo-hydrolase [Rhodohalobacter sulfatireducens]|uniref:MBL fold metallo-hydrolase n=1 Tax=Rhodohalobacter sulfatireducens TaxID=2911366 RepID=A0ABS9KDS9_9BACT|nr:MBL fold metallo-hydrolase [Rhodohalobacter sulfatireducens]MCG2588967.1 MBL fold metallo-hydrolase [Rhodohalobacter sulfatireducens]